MPTVLLEHEYLDKPPNLIQCNGASRRHVQSFRKHERPRQPPTQAVIGVRAKGAFERLQQGELLPIIAEAQQRLESPGWDVLRPALAVILRKVAGNCMKPPQVPRRPEVQAGGILDKAQDVDREFNGPLGKPPQVGGVIYPGWVSISKDSYLRMLSPHATSNLILTRAELRRYEVPLQSDSPPTWKKWQLARRIKPKLASGRYVPRCWTRS
ncbi:hypothetical protein WOLCODRAFT_14611 [Wolfiporia cocos MD-104 SS10]|uniref:Uncharacterized protein n=1 Tax=Wolfiporia cocos (strain MD-104) TaxID=742152 RepID=A0A2H3ITG1_WOLCO|nr:hypothetical protein WOLCODRAFT_14611 [Wolfiporia cocos MD-104 SS10]